MDTRLNILAVDDSAAVLTQIHAFLKDEYHVTKASSVKEAELELERTHFNLILLDIEMPGMNGLELYAQMLKQPAMKTIPVIFVTADRASAVVKKAVEMGAAGYIVKPYDATALVQKVQSVLDAAKVDQGALYLDGKLLELMTAVISKDIKAIEVFSQIPLDNFVPPIVLNLNRLKVLLSREDYDGAHSLLEVMIGALHGV